jgi:hypothetical protein
MIQKAVGPTAKALAAARNGDIKIIYLKMGYRADLSDLGAPDSVSRMRHLQRMHVGMTVGAPDGRESRILVRDTLFHFSSFKGKRSTQHTLDYTSMKGMPLRLGVK